MTVSRRDLLKTTGCGCATLTLFDIFSGYAVAAAAGGVKPRTGMQVLPAGAVKLEGYLERYIQLSIDGWSKGVVPYAALADFYRSGRPKVTYEGRKFELFATGEMWGKAVRSAAMFYRYTGDPEIKALLRRTVADLLGMRRENGTLSCSPVAKQPDGPMGEMWERAHLLVALDTYYDLVERDPAVLRAMIDLADATLAQVGPPPKVRIVDLGWSKGLSGGNNLESSALLEPIMRLHRRTGDARYREFGRYIVEVEGGALGHNIIAEVLSGRDPKDVGGTYPKAYEMLLLFEGLLEYYEATGNELWRDAAQRLFDKLIEKEITVIGNGGGDQPYHPKVMGEGWDNTALEQTNPNIKRMMETCVGVTWMRYCHHLLRLSANPAAVDYIELYAYNGLIGAMKPEGDGFSYVNLLNGVKTEPLGWGTTIADVYVTCCNLSGPVGLATLPQIAVMSDAQGLVVNLYNPAKVRLDDGPAGAVGLSIETDYPRDGAIRIAVSPDAPRRFAVKLRIPAWSEATEVRVNGRQRRAKPGSYLVIDRQWQAGDLIELNLDMRCRLVRARSGSTPGSDRFHALIRGPVVLARDENIDPRFDQPVDVIAQGQFVEVEAATPIRPDANMQFGVPTLDGIIQMVDYASVNSWTGKKVQTWLPMPG